MDLQTIIDQPKFFLDGNGKTICFGEAGDSSGVPVIYFHGFPGSRIEAMLMDGAAAEVGVRLIAIERPGYGYSESDSNRTLLQWPAIVSALADHLGLEKFHILGLSGGGPYALSCAYALSHRLIRTGIVCGLGCPSAEEAYLAMKPRLRKGLWLAARWPEIAGRIYDFLARQVFLRRPSLMLDYLAKNASPADREVMSVQETQEIFERSIRAAFNQGGAGATVDLQVYTSPWGFELDSIPGEVLFWHGLEDHTVPVEFSRYGEKHIPKATARLFDGEGHFSLPIRHMSDILRELIAES